MGIAAYISSFVTNNLDAGFTVTELTYYDQGNGAFAETNLLATHVFNGPLTNSTFDVTNSTIDLSGPYYSLTSKFIISAGENLGSVQLGIDIRTAPVPVPAALPLFASGLGVLGFAGWRKRKKAKLAA